MFTQDSHKIITVNIFFEEEKFIVSPFLNWLCVSFYVKVLFFHIYIYIYVRYFQLLKMKVIRCCFDKILRSFIAFFPLSIRW